MLVSVDNTAEVIPMETKTSVDETADAIPMETKPSVRLRKRQVTHTKRQKRTHKVQQELTVFNPDGSKRYVSKNITTDIAEETQQKKLEEWWMKERMDRETGLQTLSQISLPQLEQHRCYQERNSEIKKAMSLFHQERQHCVGDWSQCTELFAKMCFDYDECHCLLYLWPIECILQFGFQSSFTSIYTKYTSIEVTSLPFFFLTNSHIASYIEGSLLQHGARETKQWELTQKQQTWFWFHSLSFPEDHLFTETHEDIFAVFDYDLQPLLESLLDKNLNLSVDLSMNLSVDLSPGCALTGSVYIPVNGLRIKLFPSHIQESIHYAFAHQAMMKPKRLM